MIFPHTVGPAQRVKCYSVDADCSVVFLVWLDMRSPQSTFHNADKGPCIGGSLCLQHPDGPGSRPRLQSFVFRESVSRLSAEKLFISCVSRGRDEAPRVCTEAWCSLLEVSVCVHTAETLWHTSTFHCGAEKWLSALRSTPLSLHGLCLGLSVHSLWCVCVCLQEGIMKFRLPPPTSSHLLPPPPTHILVHAHKHTRIYMFPSRWKIGTWTDRRGDEEEERWGQMIMRRLERMRKRTTEEGGREGEKEGEEDERGNQQMQCGKEQRRMEDEEEASLNTEQPCSTESQHVDWTPALHGHGAEVKRLHSVNTHVCLLQRAFPCLSNNRLGFKADCVQSSYDFKSINMQVSCPSRISGTSGWWSQSELLILSNIPTLLARMQLKFWIFTISTLRDDLWWSKWPSHSNKALCCENHRLDCHAVSIF